MVKIRVVKIDDDGTVRARVKDGDIVSDGRYFYRIVVDEDGTKKAIPIIMTLGMLGELLGVEIPEDIAMEEIKVGDEIESSGKIYRVLVKRRRVLLDVSEMESSGVGRDGENKGSEKVRVVKYVFRFRV